MIVPIRDENTLIILDEILEKFQGLMLETNLDYFVEETVEPPTESYCQSNALDLTRDLYGYPLEYRYITLNKLSSNLENWNKYNNWFRTKIVPQLGMAETASFSYYPPEGFVGWHTNANNVSHQLLFTWSENGDGYFRYYDNKKKKIITQPDKKGWQCKSLFFGSKNKPLWHCCYTKGPRLTFAVKLKGQYLNDQHKKIIIDWRDSIISEISGEHNYNRINSVDDRKIK